MTFPEVVAHCVGNAEFVKEFNRLTGSRLGQSLRRTPFEAAIDQVCGYSGESEEDMARFAAFVYECVWLRVLTEGEKNDA